LASRFCTALHGLAHIALFSSRRAPRALCPTLFDLEELLGRAVPREARRKLRSPLCGAVYRTSDDRRPLPASARSGPSARAGAGHRPVVRGALHGTQGQFRTDPPAEGDIQETRTQRRQVNWEKVAYLALLALLLILVGRYVLADYFYIEGDGQVITGTFDVRFPSDVRVQEFFKEEEEHVERGAPLFRYTLADREEEDPEAPALPSEQREEALDLREEALDLEEDLTLKRIELRKKRKLLARQRDRLERIRRGTYLDVYTAEELEAAEHEATELEADVQALRQEIQTLRTKKQRLQNRSEAQQQRRRLSSSNDSLGRSRTYRAPVSGTVMDLFARPSEVVLVSERVMTINLNDSETLYVKTVFEQEALDHLSEGDRVRVAHANGEETLGRVRHLFPTSSDRADKSRSEYVQMNRRIVAEIYPDTPEARATWSRLQRMGLTVYRPKFWSPTMDLWPF